MISLAAVTINSKVREYVNQALDEGMIGQGRFIRKFEEKIKTYLNFRGVYSFFVANGTLADAVSLASLKILKADKNEVILPALTFVAQANAVLMAGLKPVFVDAGDRFNMDLLKIEEKITNKTLAIMPVHLLGIPCNMDVINEIAFRHNLFVVEDSCEALGSKWRGINTGTWGHIGTFSFFVSHTITTGEGGLIVTNDDRIANIIKSVMNHGRLSDDPLEKFQFPYFGFNAKATNIQAAIGCALVDDIDDIIEARRKNVKYLNSKLGFDIMEDRGNEYISPHCYPVETESMGVRNEKINRLLQAGIEVRTLYNSIPNNTHFSSGEIYPNALDYSMRYYYVPIHQNLTIDNLDYMARHIKYTLKDYE